MPRWDDANFDSEKYNTVSYNEETRLLKKFEDYKELEKIEFEKRYSPQLEKNGKTGIFGKYIHAMAVIQGIITAGLSTSLMFIEIISEDVKFALMSLVSVALAGEIVIISAYFRNKNRKEVQEKSSTQFERKTEFDRI